MLGSGSGGTVTLFSPTGSVAVFRDPTYRNVGAVMLIDRRPAAPASLRVRAWLNPWADRSLKAADLGFQCFTEDKAMSADLSTTWAEPLRAMTWQGDRTRLELG